MKAHESIQEYVERVMYVVNQLRDHGGEVTKVSKVLRTLSPKFEHVVAIEEANDHDKLTIDELSGSLQTHKDRINHANIGSEEKALQT